MDFVKLVDNHTILRAPLNLVFPNKTILNFRYDESLMREYGYKPLVEAEKDYSKMFYIEYEETEKEVREVIKYDSLVDDSSTADDLGDPYVDPEQAE